MYNDTVSHSLHSCVECWLQRPNQAEGPVKMSLREGHFSPAAGTAGRRNGLCKGPEVRGRLADKRTERRW